MDSKKMEDKVFAPNLRSPVKKDRFPTIVVIIMLAEFCERFSYSGMRAFLTLYLRSKLGYSDDEATEIYHIFSTFVYFFPIIGGILADNYLGKFRAILYMMFVYAAGNILVAVTAIPHLELPSRLCTSLGLFMITLGTGGIKPCVTAFGGDQFKLPQQEKYLAIYFSVLYFNQALGSLIAKTVSPILRSEVHCFGDKDCYSLAFGAPGFVVLASIVIFVSAKSRYVMKKPEGNILIDVVKCIALGLKNLMKKERTATGGHWLDSTYHQYDKRFVRDIKKTLSILTLFTVLPVYWALLDQMGSRWTLQASKMDGRFGVITVKPDQLMVLACLSILVLIPLAQKYIYPYLAKRNILKSPLQKMALGGVLAGVSFIISGSVEMYLKTTYPQLPTKNYSQLRIFNGNPCSLSAYNDNITYTIPSLSYYVNKNIRVTGTENFKLTLGGDCVEIMSDGFLLEEKKAVSFFLSGNSTESYFDNVEKSKSGFPVVRFLVTDRVNASSITFYNEKKDEVESYVLTGISSQTEVYTSVYSLKADGKVVANNINMESGGVYVVMLDKLGDKYKYNLIVLTSPNSISMAWLFPQFIIMSIAEVLYAVTGSEFAFKEAPSSMKAVMTAIWLLTEACGNVIIIVITRVLAGVNQETQFFLYTALMFLSMLIFTYLSKGYKFGHSEDEEDQSSGGKDQSSKELRSNSQVSYSQVKQEDC